MLVLILLGVFRFLMEIDETLWEVLIVLITLLSTWYMSYKFGDRAGTQASIKYDQQKEQERQEALLQGLKNQALLILSIVKENAAQKIKDGPHIPGQFNPFVEIPTVSFETALISGHLGEKRKKSINKFLAQAYTINSLIGYYRIFALVQNCPTGIVGQIAKKNEEFIKNVEALRDCLSESR